MKVFNTKLALWSIVALASLMLLLVLQLYFNQPSVYFNWKHSLVFYAGLGMLMISVSELAIGLVKTRSNYRVEVRLVVMSTIFSLGAIEIALRFSGTFQTYSELRNGMYVPVCDNGSADIYRTWTPNQSHLLQGPEFSYSRTTNSLGFSDTHFELQPDSVVVIQTYGDSYTEGDGAPSDSSYPALLEQLFAETGAAVHIQNFGVCGNDPGFCYTQMRDLGISLHPDIIVLTYGTGDLMADVLSRGGLERFNSEGWKGREKPWFEWIYASSYVVRTVCSGMFGLHYNYLLRTQAEYENAMQELEPLWNGIFAGIAAVAQQHNIKILLVKRPDRGEIDSNAYRYDFSFFDAFVRSNPVFYHFDLLPFYRDAVGMTAQNTHQYFWALDGHHNSRGYHQMAKGIFRGIREHYTLEQLPKASSSQGHKSY